MSNNISLEQSLQAYRVMNTPTKFSWKQHWAQETFSSPDVLLCDENERKQFSKRLKECHVTICSGIKETQGISCTLDVLVNTIVSKDNKNINKGDRKVVYSTSNGERPIGKKAFDLWNGFQVIDMDIKDETISKKLKTHIFNTLYKCNWFLGVTLSSSGKGLHIYTKISIPQTEEEDARRKKLLYLVNFRHKYSFVYLACLSAADELEFTKDDVLKWMDLAMFKPQQGAFIGYDPHPLINTHFFEDFIYVNFDAVEEIGHPDIDWLTYPDLKAIFKRWEWFEEESTDEDSLNIEVLEKPELLMDTGNKVHYKHFERWRLANTLVKLYGKTLGNQYLRLICSNAIKDKELQADCETASRHEKPVDVWAVNRLNSVHGFKIKLNIKDEDFDESKIFNSMERIDNPTLIHESKYLKTYNITKDQYLGDIRQDLVDDYGRVTLLEAGAGVGKTEMVKQMVRDGKKIVLVMPFTSTIKSKVENDPDWYFSYGNKKPRLDVSKGLALTIDKFSHLNLMDIKTSGFDYIFIDESHLMFQSEYRPVMSKVIEMIRNTEIPIVLMSGTPSGELIFFPDIVHIHVIKEDIRKKELKVNMVENTSDLIYYMCRRMAREINEGKRILFPSNEGTIYSKQIEAAINYFLQNDHMNFEPVRLKYYKKSNIGEKFMDDVNFEKTIADTQVLMCTTYLSVGVDILDKYNFSIYFADLILPQELDQFCNRLRANDLYVNLYVAKNDSDGNSRQLHKYKEMNLKLNEEEIKNTHSILKLCNEMIKRNPVEYKYNSLISSIIHDNKFIEHDEISNKYYLNVIAYKVIYFERKYREYAQQLPVLMKGMQCYGYKVTSEDLDEFKFDSGDIFKNVKDMMKQAHDEQTQLNTTHIQELMDIITEDRLNLYKEVLAGKFDIKKGDEWKEDLTNSRMYVKNIEVFEKVVPIFISMSKQYPVKSICDIFEYCRNKNGSYNFAAINRIRLLINLVHSDENNRLDLPIKDFMREAYEFSDKALVHKNDIQNFLNDFSRRYAEHESDDQIIITRAELTMKSLKDTFEKIFKCLIKTSRPTKEGMVSMERVELLWQTRDYYNCEDHNDEIFILSEFLGDDEKVDVTNI